ncbi:MAG TPA: hypothetical protein VGP96_00575 [Candidatus Dormibacteraeota bacterium]|nr:hypothetical protein [Candidatus Dormibacteraeota bacterium]
MDRLSADVLQGNRRMVAMLVHRGARPVPGGWAGVRHFELTLNA